MLTVLVVLIVVFIVLLVVYSMLATFQIAKQRHRDWTSQSQSHDTLATDMTSSTHHVAKYFTAHTLKLDPTRADIDALHPCVGLASATIVFPGTAFAATAAPAT